MRWLLHVVSAVLILATAIPVLRGSEWWIRIFDFPRMQVAVAAGITLALYLLLVKAWTTFDISIASLLAAAFFLQLYQIAPYTLVGTKEVFPCENASERIRLFNGNVFMENRNAAAYLDMISEHEPDVVLLLETDDWWDDAVARLASDYEHSVRLPQSNTYGMILYSKFEILDYEVRHLADDSVPSIFATLAMPSGNQITLVCLHPRPPRPDKQQDSAERDVELILAGGFIQEMTGPVIAMGDLNDVAWSRTTQLFQEISGLRDPRRGRGLYSTFHAKYPVLRWPLDHIFLSDVFSHSLIKRLPNSGSDHFPILYELCLESRGDDAR